MSTGKASDMRGPKVKGDNTERAPSDDPREESLEALEKRLNTDGGGTVSGPASNPGSWFPGT